MWLKYYSADKQKQGPSYIREKSWLLHLLLEAGEKVFASKIR